MGQITSFLDEDNAIVSGTQTVVVDGIQDTQDAHKKTIKAKYARIRKAESDKIDAEKQKVIRKEKRKLLREKKAKDEALQRFKDQVYSNIILKGEKVNILSTNLVDMDSHFCSDRMLCAYGGQLQQLYYVLEEISIKYPQGLKMYMEKKIANDDDDYFARPNNPRELLLSDHLAPFFMMYLKEMKNECIEVLLHPECSKFLKEKDCPTDEMNNLNDDDAIKFKEMFVANKVSIAHRASGKQMDTLYEFVADILTKRIVVDNPNVKIDQVHSKLVLIDIPEGTYTQDYKETIKKPPAEEGGEEITEIVEHKKNTDEMAVLLMKVP